MIRLPIEVLEGFWQRKPGVDLCVDECGAYCCRCGVVAGITTEERDRLNAKLHGITIKTEHIERDHWRWHIGKPCLFLTTSGPDKNKCSIHNERPECCRRFPARPVTWCPVWPR